MRSKNGSPRRRNGDSASRRTPLVGDKVVDQRKIRPDRPIRDLDDFIAFLAELERVFGPVHKPARARRDVIFRL